MTKQHEIRVKVYNNVWKWTESDIKLFTPGTESTPPSTQTSSSQTTDTPSTVVTGVDSSTELYVTYASPTKTDKATNTTTEGTVKLAPDIGIIVGPTVAAVVLVILIIVFVVLYIRNRKRKTLHDELHFVKAALQENKEGAPKKSLGNAGVFNPYANIMDEVDAHHGVNKSAQTGSSVKGAATSIHSDTGDNPADTSIGKASSQTSRLPVITPVISPASGPPRDDNETEDERTPELTKKEMKAKKTGIVYANRDSKDYVIPLSEFPKIVADKKHKAAFKDEHESIKDASQSINEGSKPENLNKNKYRNIRAYDHNRVILKKIGDDPHSDYINANYIDGYKKSEAYIAAQGPKEDTVDDFWRMVWEVNANIIVMLTKVVENAKSKTMQYWPEGKGSEASFHFGDIDITLDDELGLADNVTHTLSVAHKGETRRVYHLHFTSWPDKGIPRQAASLLNFRKKVRTYDDKAVGPTIVHCSAGVGRTGTYIALDMLLEQVEENDEVNIFKMVERLREQRMNMVQTQGQYIFLHDALIEHLYSVDTSITTPLFKEEYQARLQVNPKTGKTKLQEEFSNLAELRVPPAQERCEGLLPENKKKNREKLIVPANTARPYLMTQMEGRNNYINAVFVDGLVERDMFLVTQHPLPDTVVDFWRMIFDYKCQTIVMLNQTNEKEVPYWPVAGDTEMNIGPFNVEISKLDQSNPAYLIRTMLLRSSKGDKPLEVRQFHLLGWSNKEELPRSVPDLISLVNSVSAWHKRTRKGRAKKNIVVHCLNGNKKSGLFCVVYSVLDQIRFNQDVDVFRAVQVARENRYQFITSTEQYKFCFDVALEFLSQFDTYANFDDKTVKKKRD